MAWLLRLSGIGAAFGLFWAGLEMGEWFWLVLMASASFSSFVGFWLLAAAWEDTR